MRLFFVSVLWLFSFLTYASAAPKDKEELVFSCDLESHDRLLAYFKRIDKTLYFLVSGDEREIVYQPQGGMGLDNYQWVNISAREPEYVPLRFTFDDKRNAYLSMSKGGVYLSIMDAELLNEDGNSINHYCVDGTATVFEPYVRRQIERVEPNKFEAWD
ncbi:hypothetical protein [Vibrio neptunius]|uniref:C-type lysozyme inhibitor domain-containing protein n=1 Tax=Vibrio neptunius TaxID=170651 RepID=A0ABS3A8W5_9VIBR|nr:hypothetical protein [Vibrio neptunius]MBN3494815.1 hypothetical protein [Vibrio neptunius]MBN3517181.1 hypothetical protein [Vibrio neptunius]MBN3551632.1 hypothetical protein [Vibrio neptunius]MBN3579698.1 hypothetical protein [Vibrio neptunius]MCH9873363.1 hypothetical protein [Vibrio neptunius]